MTIETETTGGEVVVEVWTGMNAAGIVERTEIIIAGVGVAVLVLIITGAREEAAIMTNDEAGAEVDPWTGK